jgi:hypothetical protein
MMETQIQEMDALMDVPLKLDSPVLELPPTVRLHVEIREELELNSVMMAQMTELDVQLAVLDGRPESLVLEDLQLPLISVPLALLALHLLAPQPPHQALLVHLQTQQETQKTPLFVETELKRSEKNAMMETRERTTDAHQLVHSHTDTSGEGMFKLSTMFISPSCF